MTHIRTPDIVKDRIEPEDLAIGQKNLHINTVWHAINLTAWAPREDFHPSMAPIG